MGHGNASRRRRLHPRALAQRSRRAASAAFTGLNLYALVRVRSRPRLLPMSLDVTCGCLDTVIWPAPRSSYARPSMPLPTPALCSLRFHSDTTLARVIATSRTPLSILGADALLLLAFAQSAPAPILQASLPRNHPHPVPARFFPSRSALEHCRLSIYMPTGEPPRRQIGHFLSLLSALYSVSMPLHCSPTVRRRLCCLCDCVLPLHRATRSSTSRLPASNALITRSPDLRLSSLPAWRTQEILMLSLSPSRSSGTLLGRISRRRALARLLLLALDSPTTLLLRSAQPLSRTLHRGFCVLSSVYAMCTLAAAPIHRRPTLISLALSSLPILDVTPVRRSGRLRSAALQASNPGHQSPPRFWLCAIGSGRSTYASSLPLYASLPCNRAHSFPLSQLLRNAWQPNCAASIRASSYTGPSSSRFEPFVHLYI
ncbi:hypothetical protein B0H15DRAFT_965695 [Mycena belliarum]|uniref:Uncharacterized protein n=1 Tax=Mycena belliarum TaxID=1033014 RepID=A0AAD6TPW8_9AGAR|nr:hypothetical protein B0H15DRAFT_965695 [Mycena belliae]